MIYNSGVGENKSWIVKEEVFSEEFPGKCESIMCQGNGYLCVRAAMEDFVKPASRGLLVAGTFDLIPGDDATELANSADITNMKFTVNGEVMNALDSHDEFERTLNLKNGLLRRYFVWTGKNGKKLKCEFLRMVSLKDFHLICAKANITAVEDCDIVFESGITTEDVQKTEHFDPMGINAYNDVLMLTTKTKESGILFCTQTTHQFAIDGVKVEPDINVISEAEMQILAGCAFSLKAGQTLTITKTSDVFTNRDKEYDGCDMQSLVATAKEHMKSVKGVSFEEFLEVSAAEWQRKIWSTRDIKLKTSNEADQLAIRFAIYHLTVMSPIHDNRMNIGAKGLSGLGYRGHTFWDTEIFMLPYFIFEAPEEAASLMEYRYNSLEAARKNAKERGYDGAMFPWEAAWITDGETTPSWANTGLMEHHITADVCTGVYYYYTATGDDEFMEKYGYELVFDTAKFWNSRLTFNPELDRYEINGTIGPNEYKEDIDNNAYTNYIVQYNFHIAMEYADMLKAEKTELYAKLNALMGIDKVYDDWKLKAEKIYLPRENEDGIVPEDDTYLTLVDIAADDERSISLYPHEAHEICAKNGGLYNCMVSKQADVMLLMYLFEDLFTPEIKKKNFYFYEKRTFHDSSLSLSTYTALAADLNERETAYRLFERATMIDLGPEMWTSDPGIHAASLGGIWQCAVLGFAGVRRYGKQLRIEPNLPDTWDEITFNLLWHGQRLIITAGKHSLTVENTTGTEDIEILNGGKLHKVGAKLVIEF